MDKTKILAKVKGITYKHGPEILTGIGIAGMITTTILAVKATPKAFELLQEKEKENIDKQIKDGVPYEELKNGLPPVEVIKITWKCYVPAAVTCAASIACLIGASSANVRRNAALYSAYKLSETALSEYREKVVETVGEKKEKAIKEKVDKERVDKKPVSKSEVIVTSRGNTLCYDYLSDRYFESDIDQIKKAENTLNKQILHDLCGYVSLNEFYDELGLNHIGVGDDIGWNVDKLIDIRISSQIADDGRPCIVVNHENAPFYEYDK